ncbi:hypothetical protein [Enterocloster bolteae]|uniref:hypothetical protein n=1 Tax=Enterocloster bolteae TaxID=208479 RepID=UPI0028DB5B1C|nr:hypothetical protein [Enterocloster bolteae]
MDNLKSALFNAIIAWFDDQDDGRSIDDEEWRSYVCERTGLTDNQYNELMFGLKK